MKSRPILFSAPMVRALLDGTKTQTRRAWRDQPPAGVRVGFVPGESTTPYGQTGDQLWVREAWRSDARFDKLAPRDLDPAIPVWLEAGRELWPNLGPTCKPGKLRPGMFMCRWMSRIQLEITGVRVERLQDISEADSQAEGVAPMPFHPGRWWLGDLSSLNYPSARNAYIDLWTHINGTGSWDLNPWVWCISFRRIEP